LVTGAAQVGDDLVALLDVSVLAHLPEGAALAEAAGGPVPAGLFCPEAAPEIRALFRARAVALRETAVEEEGERLGLAVVELSGECFGIELAAVQEFCDIAHLSPIPCCPQHILGAMSLRGDLLTLIDPRAALNLPLAAKGSGKAVVTRLGEQSVGIAVDAVHDVVYLRGKELQEPPPALRERGGAEVTGTAPYAGRIMTVLDLPALLAREEWIVNETV
jgi:purine-binding chemotaxis protein CheW